MMIQARHLQVTANLVLLKLRVPKHLVSALPLEKWTDLPDGTRVNLIDANQ